MASLFALSLLVAACGGGGGGAEPQQPPLGGGSEQPQDTGASTGPTPQDGPDALYFRPGAALAADGALDQLSGGDRLFAVWNPQDQQSALKPGLKIMFFGSAQGCEAGVQGPVAAVSDERLAHLARLTGVAHAAAKANLRWTPSGQAEGCSGEAQGRSGASAVYLNADDASGGVGMLTTSGRQDDNAAPFFGPFGSGGQDGAGSNAHIGGTFINFRQPWGVADPLQPWAGAAVARVRSQQSMGAAQVDTTGGQAVQAKQQMMATFLNPTCLRENAGQPCQIQYLFNTAIVRSGVSDWSQVAWFRQGDVWFDPVQGGIPIVDGPIHASGVVTTDKASGVPLFVSQGSATQHASFADRTFDVTISFEQLHHVLRIVAGRKLSVSPASLTDAQIASVWGRAWNDRNAWVLLTGHVGQEVFNPNPEHRVQIGGGFKNLYVGPQG